MMKKVVNKKTKPIFVFGILTLMVVFLSMFVQSQQQGLYCAEKTKDGAFCQMVTQDQCDTGISSVTGQQYGCTPTSCEQTTYCSTGTCENTATGQCLPGPQATCNSAQGGYWYNKPKDGVPACQVGCCLLGEGASLVERAACDAMGKDYNVKATFRTDITDSASCSALASPQEQGACVIETDQGRQCKNEARGDCAASNGEFHAGFLCTAPELGTVCAKTKRTTCVEGKNEVYFVDSCGNIANVYDAKKIDDVAYWSYTSGTQGVTVDPGDGKGNVNSLTNGFCNYLAGSTCGTGNAQYGNYICKDLSCPAGAMTGEVKRAHGESWCMAAGAADKAVNISYFENAKPGETSYLAYCYNGEVQYEVDYFRNKLCTQNITTGYAAWIPNRWQDCIFITNEDDCLDNTTRDCKLVYGSASAIPDSNGKRITFTASNGLQATCTPKYPPGFQFWDPNSTIADINGDSTTIQSLCGFSNIACRASYTQAVAGISECSVNDEDYQPSGQICFQQEISHCTSGTVAAVSQSWAANWQGFCTSIGDCGVKGNYLQQSGKSSWNDMFIPGSTVNVDLSKIPNLNSKK